MTDFQELMREVATQYAQDHAMLKSMAASFRSNMQFSFNGNDMADLLDRLREDHIDHMV